jgi:hypothetical protein
MIEVFLGIGAAVLALLIHVVVWRLHVPKNVLPVFTFIFGCVYGSAAAAYGLAFTGATGAGFVYLSVLYFAIDLSYVLTYNGVVYDSPALSLVYRIGEAGTEGVTETDLQEFIRSRPFVHTRLKQLYRDGLVIRQGDRLELAPRSIRLLQVYDACRRILGRGPQEDQ